MAEEFWRSNVCCIVTGASRGFGKAICLTFARRFLEVQSRADSTKKISFVLMGRNRPMLDELQKSLDQLGENVHVIEVIVGSLEDLKTLRTFENALQTFGQVGPKYDHAVLIHNAGCLSDPNRLVSAYNTDDSEYLINYLELNFNSVVKLTGSFLRGFARSARKTIVNVTSLIALEPFKGLALYGAGESVFVAYQNVTSFSNFIFFSQSGSRCLLPISSVGRSKHFCTQLCSGHLGHRHGRRDEE